MHAVPTFAAALCSGNALSDNNDFICFIISRLDESVRARDAVDKDFCSAVTA